MANASQALGMINRNEPAVRYLCTLLKRTTSDQFSARLSFLHSDKGIPFSGTVLRVIIFNYEMISQALIIPIHGGNYKEALEKAEKSLRKLV